MLQSLASRSCSALTASASAATDTITATHDLAADDKVVFTDVGASTTIVPGRAYWVKSVSTTVSFKISATQGGAAITVGTATVSFYAINAANTVSADNVNGLLQSVFDNGGISEQGTATLFVPSGQKRKLSAAYATAYGLPEAWLIYARGPGEAPMRVVHVRNTDVRLRTVAVELHRPMPEVHAEIDQLSRRMVQTSGVPAVAHR